MGDGQSLGEQAQDSFPNAHNCRKRPRWYARLMERFDTFAGYVTFKAGSPLTFCLAIFVVLVWALSGPFFNYSEAWQLVVNTGTTIITFLMVFLIQQSQNKDSIAVHLKLNELLASHELASNRLVCIEDLKEDELRRIVTFYRHISELSEQSDSVKKSHSIDEAVKNHTSKETAEEKAA